MPLGSTTWLHMSGGGGVSRSNTWASSLYQSAQTSLLDAEYSAKDVTDELSFEGTLVAPFGSLYT